MLTLVVPRLVEHSIVVKAVALAGLPQAEQVAHPWDSPKAQQSLLVRVR